MMLFMSIIIHGQNVMRGVLEEKTTRVAEVVISSVKPETLLAGKVLGVGAVGLDAAGRVARDRRVSRRSSSCPMVLKGSPRRRQRPRRRGRSPITCGAGRFVARW